MPVPATEHDETAEILRQTAERRRSLTNGDGPWTVICDDWRDGSMNGGRFATFADPAYRARSLQSGAWDLTKGQGGPGFSQSYNGDETIVTYERNSAGPRLEPIIIIQEMNGLVPNAYLISEEFRLLMQLWEDRTNGNFYSFSDDGSKELAIEYTGRQIKIRTPLLRRYQAARQLDLLLFTDSVAYADSTEGAAAFEELEEDDHLEGENAVVFVGIGDGSFGRRRVFSRMLVKRVLPPPPQEQCGIWPWEHEDDNYPEFIIGEDFNGRPVKYTCDPEVLANYFGANADAPHYLTPVFFRREVLQRYYDDPTTYSVTSGQLKCASLWSVQVDNDDPDVVMVFLGDLGRDLPSSHRDHWRAHNIPPTSQMSESTYRRSFLAQFAQSENPEHVFKNAYMATQRAWSEAWGWSIYREPSGSDAQIIDRLHIPLADTDTEFEGQILNLAKLLVDLLNESALTAGLTPIANEKGIAKLVRFLDSVGYAETSRDGALLRRIQNLRSRISAHTSGSSGQAFLAEELGGLSKREFVMELMRDATQMLDDFARLSPPPESASTGD